MGQDPGVIPARSQPAPTGRIPALDGLRALSISLVLFSHLAGTTGFPDNFITQPLGEFGNFGVRIFFVISGFLITRLLLDERARTGTISFGKFYLRRTLRIFPAFYALLLAVLAAEQLGWLRIERNDALFALTYTMNYHHERAWWLGHLWSLSVEEQFYLIWPLLMSLLRPERATLAALAMVLLAPIVRIGTWYLLPWAHVGIGESFATVADSIAVGCLLSLMAARLDVSATYQAFLRSPTFLLVPVATLVCNHYAKHARFSFLVGETVMNVGIGLCVDRCVRLADGPIGRVLELRPLVYLGTLSYSLYLWQQLFLHHRSELAVQQFPLNLGLTISAALLSHYLVERPFLRLRVRVEQRQRAAG